MCPKLIELLSWNGPTVHVCCFMLARASTKTFVSRVQKTAEKIFFSRKIRYQGHSLAEVSLYSHRQEFYTMKIIQYVSQNVWSCRARWRCVTVRHSTPCFNHVS